MVFAAVQTKRRQVMCLVVVGSVLIFAVRLWASGIPVPPPPPVESSSTAAASTRVMHWAAAGPLAAAMAETAGRHKDARAAGTWPTDRMVDLVSVLEHSIALVEEAGEIVRTVHAALQGQPNVTLSSQVIHASDKMGYLTLADLKSHAMITNALRTRWPTLTVISEEQQKSKMPPGAAKVLPVKPLALLPRYAYTDEITVWVDPLDATKEFTESLTQYVTIMVGIAVNGHPVGGVIHQPFVPHTVWTLDGASSFPRPNFDKSQPIERVVVSRSHAGQVKSILADSQLNANLLTAAGAGFKALMLVNGQADAYVHATNINKWDLCAAHAVIDAAGGSMVDWFGRPLTYGSTDPALHTTGISATVRDQGALQPVLVKFVDQLRSH